MSAVLHRMNPQFEIYQRRQQVAAGRGCPADGLMLQGGCPSDGDPDDVEPSGLSVSSKGQRVVGLGREGGSTAVGVEQGRQRLAGSLVRRDSASCNRKRLTGHMALIGGQPGRGENRRVQVYLHPAELFALGWLQPSAAAYVGFGRRGESCRHHSSGLDGDQQRLLGGVRGLQCWLARDVAQPGLEFEHLEAWARIVGVDRAQAPRSCADVHQSVAQLSQM